MSFIRTGRAASIAAAALMVLAACEQQPTAAPAASALRAGGDRVVNPAFDVQEATLRWLIANKSATGLDAQCVSTGYPDLADDPGSILLGRFASNTPPVVPLSACTVDVSGITYSATGGFAQWFKLGEPVITGRNATLPAAMQLNGRLFEGYECRARLQNVWTITNCTLTIAG